MSSTPLLHRSQDMFFSDIVFPSPQLALDFSEDDSDDEEQDFHSYPPSPSSDDELEGEEEEDEDEDSTYSATLHSATLRGHGSDDEEDDGDDGEEDGYDTDDTMNEEAALRDTLSRIVFASRCRTPTSEPCSPGGGSSSSAASSSASSDTSVCSDVIDYTHINYEEMIDELVATAPSLHCPLLTITFPSSSHSISLKSFPRSSPELFLLLELNHPSLRADPWNPAPHILSAVERGDYVFLVMNALVAHTEPKMRFYSDWRDFGAQMLEGAAFLHQQRVVFRAWGDAGVFMADTGLGSGVAFERGRDPVKYYLSSFAQAKDECDAKRDVRRDTAELVRKLEKIFVQQAPSLAARMKPFFHPAQAYDSAEDARREYEMLSKALPGSLLLSYLPPPSASLSMGMGMGMGMGINGAGLLKKVFSSSFRSGNEEEPGRARKRFGRLSSFTVTASTPPPSVASSTTEGGQVQGPFDASTLTLVAPAGKMMGMAPMQVGEVREEGQKEWAM